MFILFQNAELILKLNNIEIHNILSIENASISFGDTGLVLVEGFDFDTNRANGAGKSAIFNSISYALFDKIPRKITKSEILRNGTKSGFVLLSLTTDTGENLSIKRSRPSGVEFLKDGLKIDMTQEEFEKKIGIGYSQFLSTMYNAQDSGDRFISLDDKDKKEFMLKIMNLESFDTHKSTLSAELKTISQKKDLIKVKIDGYKNTILAYKQQIVNVSDLEEKILSLEKEIILLNTSLKNLESISEPDVTKYSAIEAQIDEKLINFAGLRFKAEAKRNEINTLKNMKATAHCPECEVGLKVVSGQLVKVSDETKIQEQLSSLLSELRAIEDELLKETEVKELQKKVRAKKNEEYHAYNQSKISESSFKNSISAKNKEINSIREQIVKNDSIKQKAQEIISDATKAQEELIALTSEEDIIKTVASFFDPTGAPAYIMDGVIDYFNDAVSDYISSIWPNATYVLQPYKENRDKSISTKFSEVLTIGGTQKSVGSLSGGEFRALSLATDFAIIDVLASKFGVNINPVIVDEGFNGLDSAGKELVIDILKIMSQKREIWVIDHSAECKAHFDKVVRVEKHNGVSKIV